MDKSKIHDERRGPPSIPEEPRPPATTEIIRPFKPPEEKRGFPTTFARLFFGVITLLVIYYSYLIIKPFLMDIFLALVLFFVAKPLYLLLVRTFRGWKTIASLVTCLIIAIAVLGPLAGLATVIANQAMDVSKQLGNSIKSFHIWPWITAKIGSMQHLMDRVGLAPGAGMNMDQVVQEVITKTTTFIYNNAVGLVKGFTLFILDLFLVLFIAFFMFLQGDDFLDEIRSLSPLDPSHNEEILTETENTIKATFWGNLFVAVVQGSLGGVGFLIVGLPNPVFWAMIMIPASLVPVIGSSLIWGPAAIYLFTTGSILKGVILVFWGGVVISIVDNILRPLLTRGAHRTPMILVLFAILGGLDYFGIIGFILGPLILSFLLSLLRIYQRTFLAHPTPTPIPSVTVRTPLPPASRKGSRG